MQSGDQLSLKEFLSLRGDMSDDRDDGNERRNFGGSFSPESPDDNDNKKINMPTVDNREPDQEENMDANSPQRDFTVENLTLEAYRRQGAIPKRYSLQNFQPERASYHRNKSRRETSQSDRGHWNSKSFSSGMLHQWHREREWIRLEGYLNEDRFESFYPFDFNIGRHREGSQSRDRDYMSMRYSPFYYCIPRNAAQINVLPPGAYLVIPQTKIIDSPLRIVYHPQTYEAESTADNTEEGVPGRDIEENVPQNPPQDFEETEGASNYAAGSLNTGENQEYLYQPSTSRTLTAIEECNISEAEANNITGTEDTSIEIHFTEGADPLSANKSLERDCAGRLPDYSDPSPDYGDIDIRGEWSTNWDVIYEHFVRQIEQITLSEVISRAIEEIGDVDESSLTEEIMDVVYDHYAIQGIISVIKGMTKAEWIETMLALDPEFSVAYLSDIHDFFQGHRERIVTYACNVSEQKRKNKISINDINVQQIPRCGSKVYFRQIARSEWKVQEARGDR